MFNAYTTYDKTIFMRNYNKKKQSVSKNVKRNFGAAHIKMEKYQPSRISITCTICMPVNKLTAIAASPSQKNIHLYCECAGSKIATKNE